MPVAIIRYTAYTFHEPTLGRSDYDKMAGRSVAEYRKILKSELEAERQLFRATYRVEEKIVLLSYLSCALGILLLLIFVYVCPPGWNGLLTDALGCLCIGLFGFGFLGIFFNLSFLYSLSSFSRYLAQKKRFYMRHKRKFDRAQPPNRKGLYTIPKPDLQEICSNIRRRR